MCPLICSHVASVMRKITFVMFVPQIYKASLTVRKLSDKLERRGIAKSLTSTFQNCQAHGKQDRPTNHHRPGVAEAC